VSIPQLRGAGTGAARLVTAHRGHLLLPKKPARVPLWVAASALPAYLCPIAGAKAR